MEATKRDRSIPLTEKLSVDTLELQTLLGCGRSSAVKIGAAAEAQLRIGKRVLWSVARVQKYLDQIAE